MKLRSKHVRAFLAAYRITCSVTEAARAAGIERTLHYRWRKGNPDYAATFAAARESALDSLEDEGIRRARQGIFEPLVFQGDFTYPMVEVIDDEGEVTRQRSDVPLGVYKPSDSLLMFFLKANRPEKYRETWKGELSGPGGGAIPLETQKLEILTDDELASLLALARKLAPDLGN